MAWFWVQRAWQEPVQDSRAWLQRCPVVKKMGRHSWTCCVTPFGSSLEAGLIMRRVDSLEKTLMLPLSHLGSPILPRDCPLTHLPSLGHQAVSLLVLQAL